MLRGVHLLYTVYIVFCCPVYYNCLYIMEPKFQTSFIPKKTVDDYSRNRSIVYTDTNIFTLAATIVFIATVILYGGLFFYKNMLVKQVAQADVQLIDAKTAIDPKKIQEIIDNDSRIKNSQKILERHLATSELMVFLNDSAIKKIRFNEFMYQNKEGIASVVIDSEVQTYNSFAYQQEVLVNNEFITNPSFENITLSDNGNITFKFTGRIDPSLVSYKKAIESTVTLNQ